MNSEVGAEVEVEAILRDNARVDGSAGTHVLSPSRCVRKVLSEQADLNEVVYTSVSVSSTNMMALLDNDERDLRLVVGRKHRVSHLDAELIFTENLKCRYETWRTRTFLTVYSLPGTLPPLLIFGAKFAQVAGLGRCAVFS